MKNWTRLAIVWCILANPAQGAAGPRATVTVTNDLDVARPAETIVIPFSQVKGLLPTARYDNLVVRDAAGNIIPSQVTNMDTKGGRNYNYDDVLFQHDFAKGEKSAAFTIEAIEGVAPPFPSKVYARFVPDRLDDFAWENDHIGHRIYGPTLELPVAAADQMTSSGVDVWTKTVRYSVIDRWYGKGHNPLHEDKGEGLDMYEVGTARGLGGTGIWDGQNLKVSKNFRTWKVMANGPIRAIFELGYEPWDAGNGVMVSETKRYTVDAGANFDRVDSTFTFTGAAELTAGIGTTTHSAVAQVTPSDNPQLYFESMWESYQNPVFGKMGTAIMLAPNANFAGFGLRDEHRAWVPPGPFGPGQKVKSGEPLRFYAGAGWDRNGDFPTSESWSAYVDTFAKALRSPLKVTVAPAGN